LNIADLIKIAGNIPLAHVSTCYVNGFNTGNCREEVVVPTRKAFKRNPRGFYDVRPADCEAAEKNPGY